MNSERQLILDLIIKRNLKPGGLYPLPEFLHNIDFDGDPTRREAKRLAFRELLDEGVIIEMAAAIELTEYGHRLLRQFEPSEDIVLAIRELGTKLVTAKDAELAHLRELVSALGNISSQLGRISVDLQTLVSAAGNGVADHVKT